MWGFLIEVASIVFLPARDASIPDLVASDDELPLANGLDARHVVREIPIGAALFAVVRRVAVRASPPGRSPWCSSSTLRHVRRRRSSASPGSRSWERRTPIDDVDRGRRFLGAFSDPVGARGDARGASVALGLGALFSLGIVFVRDVCACHGSGFGVLIALFRRRAGGGGPVRTPAIPARRPAGAHPFRCRVYRCGDRGVQPASALWIAWFRCRRIRRRRVSTRCPPVSASSSRASTAANASSVRRLPRGAAAWGSASAPSARASPAISSPMSTGDSAARWSPRCGTAGCGRARAAELPAGPPAPSTKVTEAGATFGPRSETRAMTVAIVTDSAAAIPTTSSNVTASGWSRCGSTSATPRSPKAERMAGGVPGRRTRNLAARRRAATSASSVAGSTVVPTPSSCSRLPASMSASSTSRRSLPRMTSARRCRSSTPPPPRVVRRSVGWPWPGSRARTDWSPR